MQPIYLDNNASTLPDPAVLETIAKTARECYANPGSQHTLGRKARQVLEDSRETIAEIIGADAKEIVFTSGGTESNTLALRGFTRPPTAKKNIIILFPGDHPSVLETTKAMERSGWQRQFLEIDANGLIDQAAFEDLPWNQIQLVSVIWGHNETGVLQELAPLAEITRQYMVPLHVDAVQAVGRVPVNFHTSGANSLSLAAHKFHGLRGIGALAVRTGSRLLPQMLGGHQEANRRAGTEPVALIAGMAQALLLWSQEQDTRTQYVAGLRDRLEQCLLATCSPAIVHAAATPRLPNTTSMAFPGVDGEALLVGLDLAGVACSLGSTCASGSAEPAPILLAMGCLPEIANSTIRFSVSKDNTTADIEEAAERIRQVLHRLRAAKAQISGK